MTWFETKFENLYSIGSRNGIYKPSKYHGRGTKIVNMGELFGYDFIGNQPMKLVELTRKETGTSSLSDGDLLFGRRSLVEAGAGKCSLVVGLSEATTFESSIIRVRPDKIQVNPRYLYYFFRSPVGRGRISAIVSGTNVKGIRGSELSQILVRMPAKRNVQDRISDILQKYDDLIATNTRRIELLERSARLLFEEWFVRLHYPGHEHDKIAEGVPEGWSRKTLGDIAQTNAESFSSRNLPNDITYIDITSVKEGRILTKTRLTREEAPGRARRRAKDGDVIWSNVRPNLRQFALVLDPNDLDVFSTGFTVLTATSVPYSFLYVAVTTNAFVAHLVNHTTGSSYPAVRPDDFERAKILVPPNLLLEEFHTYCEPLFRLSYKLERVNEKLGRVRDLLLPRLMDGRIEV